MTGTVAWPASAPGGTSDGHQPAVRAVDRGVGAAAGLVPGGQPGSSSASTRRGWPRCCWASPPPCSRWPPARPAAWPCSPGGCSAPPPPSPPVWPRWRSCGPAPGRSGTGPAPLRLRRAQDRDLQLPGRRHRLHQPRRPRPRSAAGRRDPRHHRGRRRPAAPHPGHHTRNQTHPPVHDTSSYTTGRVDDQISNYYTPKTGLYDQRVRRLRTVGGLLGVTAVVLAALAAAFQIGGLAVWVPIVTTIATYIAAARYDHLVIEYLRTAHRLQHLRQDHLY